MRKCKRYRLITVLMVLPLLLVGCGAGLDGVLFVTKTSTTAGYDAEPPSLDLGYVRQEFVVAPTFREGQVPPVLTTIGTRPSPFEFGSNQSFATGDAAVVMADALISDVDYTFGNSNVPLPDKSGTLKSGPRDIVPDSFLRRLKYYFIGNPERRRHFFGTDTHVGLHAKWTGDEVVPSSVSIGFKRKELAYVPLICQPQGCEEDTGNQEKQINQEKTMKLASLIAITNVKLKTAEPTTSEYSIGQALATGAAATLLAGHHEIRQVLGPSVIANFEQIEALAKQQAKTFQEQLLLINWIRDRYKATTTTPQQKTQILTKARDLELVPRETVDATFDNNLAAGIDRKDAVKTQKYDELKKYIESLGIQ